MSLIGQCKYECMCVCVCACVRACVLACVRASPNGETIYMLPYDECKNIGYNYIYIYIYVYITYCVIVIIIIIIIIILFFYSANSAWRIDALCKKYNKCILININR